MNYNNALFMLKQTKDRAQALATKNTELESENYRLLVRGSVAFEELTPRHKGVKELFSRYKIKEPKPLGDMAPTYISTVQYFEKLFAELSDRKKAIKDLKKQLEDLKSAASNYGNQSDKTFDRREKQSVYTIPEKTKGQILIKDGTLKIPKQSVMIPQRQTKLSFKKPSKHLSFEVDVG